VPLKVVILEGYRSNYHLNQSLTSIHLYSS